MPKAFRDELGLRGGEEVEVALVDGRVEITPVAAELRLERAADGRLVASVDAEVPPLSAERVRELLEQVRR